MKITKVKRVTADGQPIVEEEKKIAEKNQIIKPTEKQPVIQPEKKDLKSADSKPVSIESVNAFQKTKLPKKIKQMIVDLYNEMNEANNDTRMDQVPVQINVPKFTTAKVFMGKYPETSYNSKNNTVELIYSNIADIYINDDGAIDYKILPENKLGIEPDILDGIVAELILFPTVFATNLNIYSVLETPDLVMNIIKKQEISSTLWIEIPKSNEIITVDTFSFEKDKEELKNYFIDKKEETV